MEIRFWSDGSQLTGAVVATAVVYLAVLVAVRVAGRRTTAQLSAYDTLITVALGTALTSTALPSDPAVADGLAVLATLLVLQLVIGQLRRTSGSIRRLTDFAPKVVLRDGEVRSSGGILGAQLTDTEIEAELRRQGITSTDEVVVVVLESSGSFSVLGAGHQNLAERPWGELIADDDERDRA
jgi:uncharacterized membrane protein YcaP (DUF421 family)